jgi:hypothetical protein
LEESVLNRAWRKENARWIIVQDGAKRKHRRSIARRVCREEREQGGNTEKKG